MANEFRKAASLHVASAGKAAIRMLEQTGAGAGAGADDARGGGEVLKSFRAFYLIARRPTL
ncbi:hypothetical protein CIW54_24030 [Paraburkholderia sp. T12-10]|nr:hypothetical protein CIW54_24030 [Paraburkholderia sp. T12-10]